MTLISRLYASLRNQIIQQQLTSPILLNASLRQRIDLDFLASQAGIISTLFPSRFSEMREVHFSSPVTKTVMLDF